MAFGNLRKEIKRKFDVGIFPNFFLDPQGF
jgi:hypothetical protein